ncbi:MAG TPA: Fic family protein [Flavilitoribacter sp.]|nr:Fic family protein [Flavilitoribacter sp.]HMQ87714.1 Fic family protein [Flavilitoribacter sp.]
MQYNWQLNDWPDFRYDLTGMEKDLLAFAQSSGHVKGLFKALPEPLEEQARIDIMVAEAVKTSEIEGEIISREDVLSSLRNNLGLNRVPEHIKDKRAEGIAKLMVDVRKTYGSNLTIDTLFNWHLMVMEPFLHINKGKWRSGKEPMQIISGAIGKEIVHFEAPPSDRVPEEMEHFIQWFNKTAPGQPEAILHPAVRSAVAHLYFESIHPFEDGNGRIGRAVAEKAISQGINGPAILSISNTLEKNRQAYYEALKKAQRSNEITPWIRYFLDVLLQAQHQTEAVITFTIAKVRFFEHLKEQLNERQEKVLRRMLDAGPDGFQGGINARKYVSITRTSKATATRDLQNLVALGALAPLGSGRNARYEIRLP